MRVPIPLVLFLCLAVVGGVWWFGSHSADFLSPPDASELAEIRMRVESSLPPVDHPGDAVSVPDAMKQFVRPLSTVPELSKPVMTAGDSRRPPGLEEYANLTPKNAESLSDLAVLLETKGQFQRALLAWERVLDTTKPDESQANSAITAIKRLRPTLPDWNTDSSQAIPITLHAGTGKKTAQMLTPILEKTASDLERASAGILKVTAIVTAGRDDLTAYGPPPVALWLAGPEKNTRSTEVLSFTVDSPEDLPDEVHTTVFRILRGYLARETSKTSPRTMLDGTPPLEALDTHITRLSWQELGNLLNLAP